MNPCEIVEKEKLRSILISPSAPLLSRLAAGAIIDICLHGDDSVFISLREPLEKLLSIALSGAERHVPPTADVAAAATR